jgi:predicted hydrocarbon binding protein
MAVAFIEALLKEKGYKTEFTYAETRCVAKGDNICEFKFQKRD